MPAVIVAAAIAIGILVVVIIHDRRRPDTRGDKTWTMEWILGLVAVIMLWVCLNAASIGSMRDGSAYARAKTHAELRSVAIASQAYFEHYGR